MTSNKRAVKAVNQLFFPMLPQALHFPSKQTRITGNYRRTGEKKCCLMYTCTVRCIHTCLVSPGERYMILFSVKHVISEPFSFDKRKNFKKKFLTRKSFLCLIGMAYVWQHIINNIDIFVANQMLDASLNGAALSIELFPPLLGSEAPMPIISW